MHKIKGKRKKLLKASRQEKQSKKRMTCSANCKNININWKQSKYTENAKNLLKEEMITLNSLLNRHWCVRCYKEFGVVSVSAMMNIYEFFNI